MAESSAPALIRLSRTDVTLDDPLGNARGQVVITVDDDLVGTVVDLVVDRRAQTILFLEIDAEGLEVVGPRMILIPAEAVHRVAVDHVSLVCRSEVVATAPTHNPHVVQSSSYVREVYEHFGVHIPIVPPGVSESET